MEEENIMAQAEEIKILKSIYTKELIREYGSYTFKLSPTIKLFITLPPDYPSKKPPTYELMAHELTADEKKKLREEFNTIYDENMGGTVLYQWFEKLKEYTVYKTKYNRNIKRNLKSSLTTSENSKFGIQRFSKEAVHGPVIKDRKSVFQGHACAVFCEEDVRNFLEYLIQNKKIGQATHNIYAYTINSNSSLLEDCEDDGEKHASKGLLHLLQILHLSNVMVVVSRWKGNIQLGPDRFKHITTCARQALEHGGFIE